MYPLFWIGLSFAALTLDYLTGRVVRFPILFVVPVALASWQSGKSFGMGLAILLPLIRFGFNFLWPKEYHLGISALNAASTFGVLGFIAYLVDRTSRQTQELAKRVNILHGLLPICSSCKKIRNEKGEYEPVEEYIRERSEATFTHGLCRDCLRALYPDYAEKLAQGKGDKFPETS